MDKNRVLGAVLEPGEAGKSYPGSAGQGHLPLPRSNLALKREMPCSGRATLHMDFIPLPFVPVSSVVCLIWSCLSLFHKSTRATGSPMDGEREGTTCTTPAAPAEKGGCRSCFWQVLLSIIPLLGIKQTLHNLFHFLTSHVTFF